MTIAHHSSLQCPSSVLRGAGPHHPENHVGHRGVIRSYRVRLNNVETGSERIIADSSSPLVVSDLHPFYNYRISVAAYTVALGPYSTIVSLRMPPDSTTLYHIHYIAGTSVYTPLWDQRWGGGGFSIPFSPRALLLHTSYNDIHSL